MSEGDLIRVADRIRRELTELERVVNRIDKGWKLAKNRDDDIYVDSVAYNLQGFYSGLERTFSVITKHLDGNLPQGDSWHLQLLEQMTTAKPPYRPAVISQSVGEALNDYRGFPHVARNVYYHRLDPKRIGELVKRIPKLYSQVKAELSAFAAFLEARQP